MGGGMLAGHVLAPYGAALAPGRLALFAVVMAALGAWRGRAEVRVYAEWNGRPAHPGRERAAAAVGALAALLAAAAGFALVHG